MILVANKCDMDEDRVVSYERGKMLADQLGELVKFSSYQSLQLSSMVTRYLQALSSLRPQQKKISTLKPFLRSWWI